MKRKTKKDLMLQIYSEYMSEFGRKPVSSFALYEWAKKTGRWKYIPTPFAERNKFSQDLSDALRQQVYTDPQGRQVRTKHAVRKEINDIQTTLWGDLRYDPVNFIKLSFSQCRKQIVDDNVRLKTDVDSFNENRKPEEPYTLELDYSEDVKERELKEKLKKDSDSSSERVRPSGRSLSSRKGSDSSPAEAHP